MPYSLASSHVATEDRGFWHQLTKRQEKEWLRKAQNQKERKEGKRNTVRKNTRRLTQCPSVRNEGKNAKARIKGAVVLQPPSASTKFAVADELWNETPEIGVEGLIAILDDNILLLQGLKKGIFYRPTRNAT
jgi:hypothetical protein